MKYLYKEVVKKIQGQNVEILKAFYTYLQFLNFQQKGFTLCIAKIIFSYINFMSQAVYLLTHEKKVQNLEGIFQKLTLHLRGWYQVPRRK